MNHESTPEAAKCAIRQAHVVARALQTAAPVVHLSIWLRFVVYGSFGLACEAAFTLARRGTPRDWLALQTRAWWMFPIYGLAVFLFEPMHDGLRGGWLPVRGACYTAALFACELASGALLRATTGRCPWDYTGLSYNYRGLVRWSYAPLWLGYCLALERLHDLMVR